MFQHAPANVIPRPPSAGATCSPRRPRSRAMNLNRALVTKGRKVPGRMSEAEGGGQNTRKDKVPGRKEGVEEGGEALAECLGGV